LGFGQKVGWPCKGLSDYDQTELERHVDIIVRNIEAKRIEAEPHTDSRSKWRFTPEALAEWCATQGISYPLPIIQGLPTTDSGLRQALAKAHIEIARLKERIAALENENAKLQASPEPLPDFKDTSKTKGERQEAAVLYWVVDMEYSQMSIPDGGKGILKIKCQGSYETKDLFKAKTAFDETWKRLREKGIIMMESHTSFTRKSAI